MPHQLRTLAFHMKRWQSCSRARSSWSQVILSKGPHSFTCDFGNQLKKRNALSLMNYWIPLLFFWFSTSPQTAASEKHFAATAASIIRPGTCDDLALLTPFAERWWCEQHSDSQFLNIVSCHLLWMSVFEFDRWHLSMVQVVTGNLRWMEGARVKAHSIVICHCPWSALPIYNARSVSATGPLKRDSWAIALLKGLLKSEIIYIIKKSLVIGSGHNV